MIYSNVVEKRDGKGTRDSFRIQRYRRAHLKRSLARFGYFLNGPSVSRFVFTCTNSFKYSEKWINKLSYPLANIVSTILLIISSRSTTLSAYLDEKIGSHQNMQDVGRVIHKVNYLATYAKNRTSCVRVPQHCLST